MRWSALLAAALFVSPIIEASVVAPLVGPYGHAVLFPLCALVYLGARPSVTSASVVLVAATWRDILLVTPFAGTLIAATTMVGATLLVSYVLTNRSLFADVTTSLVGYGCYAIGFTVASLLASYFAAEQVLPVVAVRHLLIGLGLAIVSSAFGFWRGQASDKRV